MPETGVTDKLAEYVVNDLFKWFKDERSEQLEDQMRRNYDAFRGRYNSDALKKWRATEGNDWRSKVFVRLTKQKVFTYFNQVMAVALQNGEIPWDIQPSKIAQGPGGVTLNPEEAARRCDGMRMKIGDDFQDSRAAKTMLSAGLEGAIYGFSWIRSPVMRPYVYMGVNFGIPNAEPLYYTPEMVQQYGRHTLSKRTQLRPAVEGPGVWNTFWDLETSDHQKGHGICIRDMMSKGRFLDLQDAPGYDKKAIESIVSGIGSKDTEAGEEDDSEGPIRERMQRRRRVIPTYSFYGRVPRSLLAKHEAKTGKLIPGLNGRKFHLVEAASSTSSVSIPIRLNIRASSLTNAMLMSRCEFSITLAASATLMEGARCVPASITERYSPSITEAARGLEPEVTFLIFVTVCSLSPGLIRSGEYPTLG